MIIRIGLGIWSGFWRAAVFTVSRRVESWGQEGGGGGRALKVCDVRGTCAILGLFRKGSPSKIQGLRFV